MYVAWFKGKFHMPALLEELNLMECVTRVGESQSGEAADNRFRDV